MTRPTTTGKAQDLITFTRSTTGTALAKISYGEEVVTNGDFSSGSTGWNVSQVGTFEVVSGRAKITSSSGNQRIYQEITGFSVGKAYTLSLELEGAYAVYVSTSSTSGGSIANIPYAGSTAPLVSKQLTFTATSSTLNLVVYVIGTNNNVFIDNVSVKEVLYDQPDGTLQLFNHPINKPRIEYDASGNCLGLLVEEARTNSQGNSENIDAAWSQKAAGRTEVLSNQITAPDGTSSADLIQAIDGSSSGEQYSRRFISSISSTNTLSVFVKKKNWRYIAIRLIGNRVFDFDTEAFTSGSGTIQKLPNGWYRLSVTDAAGGPAYIGVGTASNASVIPWPTAPQNNEGVYVWGAQLEEGSFPTSYIPTSGSAVTRAADVASLAVSEFGYNQDQGSVVAQITYTSPDAPTGVSAAFGLDDGTSNNRMWYYANKGQWIGSNSGSTTFNVGSSPYPTIGVLHKASVAYKVNDFPLAIDGAFIGTATSSPVPVVNFLGVGKTSIGTYLNGHIKSIQYYPLRLSNAQLQALTV